MNEGVELILRRMETNPEDFEQCWGYDRYRTDRQDKWHIFMEDIRYRAEARSDIGHNGITNSNPVPFLTDEEVAMVYKKWLEIQSVAYTKSVYRELLRDKNADDDFAECVPVKGREVW